MNNGVTVWLIIFALSAAGFFIIAAIVAVKGFGDLQALLRHSGQRDEPDNFSEETKEKFPNDDGRI